MICGLGSLLPLVADGRLTPDEFRAMGRRVAEKLPEFIDLLLRTIPGFETVVEQAVQAQARDASHPKPEPD